jgi:dCMP deaminase
MNERWYTYFFDIARTVAKQSKDPSTQVGAIVVDTNHRIVATGYNGFPKGCDDNPELYADRNYKLKHVCHAEANCVCQAASSGQSFQGGIIFITLRPCVECAKLIIQSGIKEVHFLHNSFIEKQREEKLKAQGALDLNDWRVNKQLSIDMLNEAGIEIYQYETGVLGDRILSVESL